VDVLATDHIVQVLALPKAVGHLGSVVGIKWSQLETFVVFIIVSSSNSNNYSSSS